LLGLTEFVRFHGENRYPRKNEFLLNPGCSGSMFEHEAVNTSDKKQLVLTGKVTVGVAV
jgi:hypothetical protein